MKTKCSKVAAAALNLFLIITRLNMPSLAHSLPSMYQILCNISISNWVVGTWSNKFKMAGMLDCWKPDYWAMWHSLVLIFRLYDAKICMTPKLWLKLWIFENLISDQWLSFSLGCRCSNLPNFVQKCWFTPKLWPKIEIKNGGSPQSCTKFGTVMEKTAYGSPSVTDQVLLNPRRRTAHHEFRL